MAIALSILREVATKEDVEKSRVELKQDIENLRNEMKQEIERLRNEMRQEINNLRRELDSIRKEMRLEIDKLGEEIRNLDRRLSRVEGTLNLLIKVFIAFNIPILAALIGILIKLALG